MRRFPDIIVISWQCDCDNYMSHSIDLADINVARTCEKCRRVYTIAIGDFDVPISVIPPRAALAIVENSPPGPDD